MHSYLNGIKQRIQGTEKLCGAHSCPISPTNIKELVHFPSAFRCTHLCEQLFSVFYTIRISHSLINKYEPFFSLFGL